MDLKLKSLESGCNEYPYYWESLERSGLNKDVDLQNYDIDDRLSAECYGEHAKDRCMINLEICDFVELGDDEEFFVAGGKWDRYELRLWWLGDYDRSYTSNSKSVIKSMFFQGAKFLIKKLNKPNLTKEDVSKAYDDCADMLEQRYIIESKRAELEFRNRDMGRRLRVTFPSISGDLRKRKTWTDEQVLERIERDKAKANKIKQENK